MSAIIPTVFSHDREDFDRRLGAVYALAPAIHIDIMDGAFVKDTSIRPEDVPELGHLNKDFEAHLMVQRPDKWLDWAASRGFSKVIFHYEAMPSEQSITQLAINIADAGMEPMIAKNPQTPIEQLYPFTEYAGILLMGHEPGIENAGLEPSIIYEIRALRKHSPDVNIQVDGGVDPETLPRLVKAGCDLLNAGSYVTASQDPQGAYEELVRSWHHAIAHHRRN